MKPIMITLVVLIIAIWVWIFTRQQVRDLDCSDFKTTKDATLELRKHKTDIYHLDADGDGQACDNLPYGIQ